ncbi:hypothetical protein JMN23_00865 [Bacillus sp. RHFB]|nr:hypothetical protein [Bacillus sp. RHFB]
MNQSHLLVNLEQILVKLTHLLVSLTHLLVSLIVTEDFKQFPQENGAEIRKLGTLLVNQSHLLVNLEQILVKLTHLLVSLTHLLVSLIVTEDFKQFPQENGAEIREWGTLLVNQSHLLENSFIYS